MKTKNELFIYLFVFFVSLNVFAESNCSAKAREQMVDQIVLRGFDEKKKVGKFMVAFYGKSSRRILSIKKNSIVVSKIFSLYQLEAPVKNIEILPQIKIFIPRSCGSFFQDNFNILVLAFYRNRPTKPSFLTWRKGKVEGLNSEYDANVSSDLIFISKNKIERALREGGEININYLYR